MLNSYFAIIGIILNAIGGISYIIYTIQGKVKPNRVTYLFWSIAPLIAFAAEINQGVGIQSLLTFSVGFLPLLVVIASFLNKESEWKLTKFDVSCGVLSLLGLIIWLITKTGNIAISFSILADALAAFPTIIKSYKYPETENGLAYLLPAIGGLITLLTITNWDFAHYAFPAYYFILMTIIFILIKFGRKRK